MNITKKPYGVDSHGNPVTEYSLVNDGGAYVSVIDFGGTLTRVVVPDRDGKLDDVILGYDDVTSYNHDSGSMGALIGRFGNRIGGAAFDLEGIHYELGKNDGANNLHGGPDGFDQRMWKAVPAVADGKCTLTLTLTSPDGDQGFPGKLDVEVVYSFDNANALTIAYRAVTDKPTLVNLTNHAYFNLEGCHGGTVHEHVLQVFADSCTEVGAGLIPTGKLIPSSELAYGFAKATRIGDVLAHTATDKDMRPAGGVDFNYCAGHDRETKHIATLSAPKTGRVMKTITDLPGVQVYTGQGVHQVGKNGVQYQAYSGVCLETQRYPDGIHHAHFPSQVLRPGETYLTTTQYIFSVE